MSSSVPWPRSQYVTSPAGCSKHAEMLADEDNRASPICGMSPLEQESLSPADDPSQRPIKSELTQSPDFRLLRPSAALPRQPHLSATSPKVAIQAPDYTLNTNNGSQDVLFVVNHPASYLSSPATRSDAFSHYLGPSVSSSSPHHALINRRQRPRTSNQVFTSSHGPIAPHGLPQRLPPAPSTAPRRTHSEQSQPQLPDFSSMASNYLNMLAQKPTDNTMPADGPVIPPPPAGSSDNFQDIFAAVLEASMPPPPTPATPDLWTSPAFSNFGDEFPPFSPDEELLNTPVVADDSDMLTGMLFGGAEFSGDLFPPMDYAEFSTEKPTPPVPAMSLPDNLHTFTPESPMLHDFHRPSINPSAIYPSPISADLSSFPSPAPPVTQNLPKNRSAAQSTEPEVSSRRRSSGPTGTRKGVTPDALVPVDAPTQPRKYVTPSATSRKEVPLVFAKKRARSTAFGDEEDEFTEVLPPNATEKETIEYKRRQNTVAARRSRKRKLQYQQDLEQKVERLQRESDVWRTRATLCQNMLIQHGVPFTPFPDSIED